jgi:mRNA interferase RelE/StbE
VEGYEIEFSHKAAKAFYSLPKQAQNRLKTSIDGLALDPRPAGCEKMTDVRRSAYRIKVGTYRVVYLIDDARSLITVVRVGHRKDVYRGL